MLLSKRWLNDYIDTSSVPNQQYASDLTMSGSKVEGFEEEGALLDKIVVGKVLSVEKHPNADTLYICKVDVGQAEPLQIVTGADNVVPEAWVPVALHGSTLADGKKITKGKLRGEVSNGMLCSLEELGLAPGDFPYANPNGIFLLEERDLAPGQNVKEAIGLNDTVFEFEITSNRPDCLSVLGLARETAATYGRPFQVPTPQIRTKEDNIKDMLRVSVENPKLCLRYAAAAVKNVRINPSPRWIRERLRASGVRPINNIVDITNFVMLEYGQPMHAFDLKNVAGAHIVVRNAKKDEKIITLDAAERTLSPEMLVIADSEKPSAIAGVMGGEGSGIYDDTTTVIFESACFDGPSVRMTSKKLGLRTESSGRFEKGLDPENCIAALKRACELVELLAAGTVVDGIIDIAAPARPPVKIGLDAAWVNRFVGAEIPKEEMVGALEALGFAMEGDTAVVPSFRAGDIEGKADLAEEIARIYGYDKIPSTAIRGEARGRLTSRQKYSRLVNQILLAQGLSEIITYSFISPKYYDKISLPEKSLFRDSITIRNPLGEDTSVMRTTALPSMLEALARNYNNRVPAASFYEIATIYLPTGQDTLPDEKLQIAMGFYGEGDFYDLKGIVEALLSRSGITSWEVQAEKKNPSFHPGRCANLFVCGEPAGFFGQIHPMVGEAYGISTPIYAAQLDFEVLLKFQNPERDYKPMPRFPASTRDLALVCDEAKPVGEILTAISTSIGGILESATLFDVYRGEQIGAGQKSVAYALTLRASDHTLTDEECDKAVAKALAELGKVGIQLRS